MNVKYLVLMFLIFAVEAIPAEALNWGPDEGKMDWSDAMGRCQSKGMRLPTSDELIAAHAKATNK